MNEFTKAENRSKRAKELKRITYEIEFYTKLFDDIDYISDIKDNKTLRFTIDRLLGSVKIQLDISPRYNYFSLMPEFIPDDLMKIIIEKQKEGIKKRLDEKFKELSELKIENT